MESFCMATTMSVLVVIALSCDENILLKEKVREEFTEECEFSFIFANNVTLEKRYVVYCCCAHVWM